MSQLEGKQVLMRIFIASADKFGSVPLYKALIDMMHSERIAGATVLRGVMGYANDSMLHSTNLLRLSDNLPMVIEVVETEENLDRIMPQVNEMIKKGMITREAVDVIRYTP